MLYKYRNFNENNLDALMKNCFWAASVNSLNDVFEGESKKEKVDRLIGVLYSFFPNQSEQIQHIDSSHESLRSHVINKCGIYSLSLDDLNDKMWALYGDSHKGFCIEFDDFFNSEISNQYHHLKVKYQKKISQLNPHFTRSKNDSIQKILTEIIGIKSKQWEYESEYRIITDKIGLNQYPVGAVKSIIFGLKTTSEDKEKIFNILKGRSIKYYQIKKDSTKDFKLCKVEIDSPYKNDTSYLNVYVFSNNTDKISFSYEIKHFNYLISKAQIIINLESKISKENLIELSKYLKDNLIPTINNYWIFYYYEKQINRDIVWANCISSPNYPQTVNINDFM